jgi:hypothetical protein
VASRFPFPGQTCSHHPYICDARYEKAFLLHCKETSEIKEVDMDAFKAVKAGQLEYTFLDYYLSIRTGVDDNGHIVNP